MAVDPNLNFNFTLPDQTGIHAALDGALLILNMPTVPYVNLTLDERKNTPSISAERLPYVHDAVNNILPVFPNLASPSIPLARATTLFELVTFVQSVVPKMAELNDRLTDLGINAEHLVYKSMLDSYNTAKQQEGRMPGADVLIAAIAPLFEDQGSNAEEPPIEGPKP
ncbi:MAG: hypothetical protein K9J06_03440 [Flavobacteriales bacterium]|nr:hypothetical protein [Flavobacteriales bacterium]